jgi:hypothetical protein
VTWAQTWSGAAVDLLAPDPATIRLADIAWSLSRLPRFLGHTRGGMPYSVAQHSVLCESLVPAGVQPAAKLAVLLHDAHEAYTGDIPTPLKTALAELRRVWGGDCDPLRVVQDRLQDAIETAFGFDEITWCGDTDAITHKADRLALAIEKRDLMGPAPRPWGDLPSPAGQCLIIPRSAEAAEFAFVTRLRALVDVAGLTPRPGVMS